MAIGTTAAIIGGAAIAGGASLIGSSKAAKASKSAADTSAAAQMAQLEYLKEREAIPQQFREEALTRLGGLAGLEGGEGTQQQLIDQAKASPFYQEMLGGRQAGEEAILRQAGATGGLRSGNVQDALARFSGDLQNRALLESYNQQLAGLQGLASIPSNANQIGNVMAGIGQTQASGQIAAAQAQQQGFQNVSNIAGGALGQYINLKGMGVI